MTDIEKRARELLAAEFADGNNLQNLKGIVLGRVNAYDGALRAVVAALTPPEGYVLVPVEPTEEMLEAGRTAVMARECSGPLWGAGDHYEAGGYPTDGIPSRLLEGKGKMSKAHCAELAYSAMLAARPETPDA